MRGPARPGPQARAAHIAHSKRSVASRGLGPSVFSFLWKPQELQELFLWFPGILKNSYGFLFLWFYFFPWFSRNFRENSYGFFKIRKNSYGFSYRMRKFLCISHFIFNIFLNKIKHFEAKYFFKQPPAENFCLRRNITF